MGFGKGLGWPRDCCFLLQALLFDFVSPQFQRFLKSGALGSSMGAWQHGSLWSLLVVSIPFLENRKQQWSSHRGVRVAASPLVPEAQSSGFPVCLKALWSIMRYLLGSSSLWISIFSGTLYSSGDLSEALSQLEPAPRHHHLLPSFLILD